MICLNGRVMRFFCHSNAMPELFSCCEALEAQLGACMEGLSFPIQRSDLPIITEMDSIIGVKLIQPRNLGSR